MNVRGERIYIAISSVLMVGVLLLNLSWTVRNSYSRDENMFVAGAALLSGTSLAPYHDFHFLHPPNQILVYSILFRFTDHYLLAGRFLSAVCAAGIVALVLWITKDFFRDRSMLARYAVAWLSILFLVANPLYVFASGYLWDYNLAGLFAILAFGLFLKGKETSRTGVWLLASGLAFGLALGTRLNYIVGLVPLFGLLALYPTGNSIRGYLRLAAPFCLGLGVGLLPTIYYAFQAPREFWFDNFTYHRLNTIFRTGSAFEGAFDLGEQLSYFWNTVITQPGNLLLLLALIFFGYLILAPQVKQDRKPDFTSAALLLLVPFIGLGAFLSTPTWYQYFYAPVPFAICAVAYGLGRVSVQPDQTARRLGQLFVVLVLLSNLFQLQEYRRVTFLLHPESWRPLQLHQLGKQIHAVVGEGKLLTLAPELAMEAGLSIYPEFTTGPFIWRVASLVPAEERQALDLIAPEDLESFLAQEPPAGILVGIEPSYEGALQDYANKHGYREVELTQEISVWLPGTPVANPRSGSTISPNDLQWTY